MKKHKIILICLFIFSEINYAQFPLEIGNRWDFSDGSWNGQGSFSKDTTTYYITADTTITNGQKYFRISPAYLFKDFVRADSIGLYYYDTMNNREWLLFKFEIGDGVNGYPNSEHISAAYMRNIADTNNYLRIYKWGNGNILLFSDSVRAITYFIDTGQDDSYFLTISLKYGFIGTHQSDMFYNYDSFLIGCRLSGITYGFLTSVIQGNQIPREIILYQNYPNPFNPNTIIQYQISQQSKVKLVLFDILGNKIKELVNEYKLPGMHQYILDASNLSSGIYIYQLQTNDKIVTKKTILLK